MKKIFLISCVLILAFTFLKYEIACGQCPTELSGKKVAIVIAGGSPEATSELIKHVVALFEPHLLNAGLQVIDQSMVEKIIPEQEKQLILRGDTVGAIKLSEKLGADLLLAGQLSVNVRSIEGVQTNLKSVYVTLNLKLLSARTAQAITSKLWTGKTAGSEISRAVIGLIEKNSEGLIRGISEEYCQKGMTILGAESKSSSGPVEPAKEKDERLPLIEGDGKSVPSTDGLKGETAPKSSTSLDNL
jgi:hypothetical protein